MIKEPKTSILITGGNGRLGRTLSQVIKEAGIECLALDRKEFDVTDYDSIARIVGIFKPQIIIHTAAYTNVDGAEKNWRAAMKINLCGTDNLIRVCQNNDIAVLFMSTDYVFDGEMQSPYLEDDRPSPVNVYGWSKLAGEYAIISKLKDYFIVRTSFLFGTKGDFIRRLLDAARGNQIPFQPGHFSSPTYYKDLAQAILSLVRSGKYGVYHITNSGCCSRYQFAKTVLRNLQIDVNIIPTPGSRITAPRPHYSVLANHRWIEKGFIQLRSWQSALLEYLSNHH